MTPSFEMPSLKAIYGSRNMNQDGAIQGARIVVHLIRGAEALATVVAGAEAILQSPDLIAVCLDPRRGLFHLDLDPYQKDAPDLNHDLEVHHQLHTTNILIGAQKDEAPACRRAGTGV